MPRASATWFWFKPYVSTSSFAMAAFIAGMTDFTAISHGISKCFVSVYFVGGKGI